MKYFFHKMLYLESIFYHNHHLCQFIPAFTSFIEGEPSKQNPSELKEFVGLTSPWSPPNIAGVCAQGGERNLIYIFILCRYEFLTTFKF